MNRSVSFLFLAIAVLGIAADPSLGQQPGAVDPKSTAPAVPTSPTAGAVSANPAAPAPVPGKVPESLIGAIDAASIEDLRAAVDLAHNSLSRKGQEALMDRARVEHSLRKAEAIVQALQKDISLSQVAQVLESPATRTTLLALVEMSPEKMSEAFQEFIKANQLTGATLKKFAKLRDAEATIAKAKLLRQKIDDSLNRAVLLPADPSSDPSSTGRMSKQLDEIATRYGGEGPEAGGGPAAPTSPDDLKTLLLTLLGTSK